MSLGFHVAIPFLAPPSEASRMHLLSAIAKQYMIFELIASVLLCPRAIDMAVKFPHVSVVGVDINPPTHHDAM